MPFHITLFVLIFCPWCQITVGLVSSKLSHWGIVSQKSGCFKSQRLNLFLFFCLSLSAIEIYPSFKQWTFVHSVIQLLPYSSPTLLTSKIFWCVPCFVVFIFVNVGNKSQLSNFLKITSKYFLSRKIMQCTKCKFLSQLEWGTWFFILQLVFCLLLRHGYLNVYNQLS